MRRHRRWIVFLLAAGLVLAGGSKVNWAANWRTASRDSAGIAPKPGQVREAVVQVYAGRAFGWRGALAVHTWIAVKPEAAPAYTTYEVIGWYAFRGGSALNVHNGDPDRRWFGARPEVLADVRGAVAARAIARIEAAVEAYPYKRDYRTWPGPNSNTFVAHVARCVPEFALDLPPTAIGKDYMAGGVAVGRAPSATGIQASLFGLLGVLIAPEEGLEINLLGLAFGIDVNRPALRLPIVGRIGF